MASLQENIIDILLAPKKAKLKEMEGYSFYDNLPPFFKPFYANELLVLKAEIESLENIKQRFKE